ncbi:helix-turn-helix domain-containing protein [Mycolicibacterium sp. OfavD-34-C]|uniref:helix-turn-helix domain-containing protein n=1 Tax=Mycolicibacterium sp. OfavD-34-C TaxID=2917746 RepID=UPI001EF6B474|nr:helix-turn-helix domain-containing protein [Mycolicibacterium sp. OfavD-34-C]MCG7582776.1 helix-turn-helix domain-containing protein [Mycolicibacterium sp. OfavD-34-C]
MKPAPTTARPMNLKEAADFLGVTDRTVRNYIAQGRLKAHRVGPKLLRITPDELNRFLEGT